MPRAFAEQAFVEHAHVEFAGRAAVFQQVEAVADGGADNGARAGFVPGPLQRFERIDRGDFEIGRGPRQEGGGIHAVDQPVRGQDAQAGGVHVDEGHHDAPGAGEIGVFLAECQRGFVAVVAVGDEQLLVRHQLADALAAGNLPHAVYGAVLVGHLGQRRRPGGFIEQGVHGAGGVGIEHEDLAEVGVGVAQQLEAVLLGAGEGLLVAVNHAGGIVLHRSQRDEAFAHQVLAGVGDGEFLEIGEDAGLRVARQNAGGGPIVQVARGAGIDVVGVRIARAALAQNHAHQVIRAGRQVAGLHGRGNLVVRLRDQAFQGAGRGRVAQGLKGVDASQISG